MSGKDRILLESILDSIGSIRTFIGDRPIETLISDDLLLNAVVKKFENIGEASNRLTPETKEAMPSVAWSDIIGMRNVMIHDYLGINPTVVMDSVINDISPLFATVTSHLAEYGNDRTA